MLPPANIIERVTGRFASWPETILDPEQAIIVVAADRVDEAIMGLDNCQSHHAVRYC
jgi:hypothetical protein